MGTLTHSKERNIKSTATQEAKQSAFILSDFILSTIVANQRG